MEYRPSYNKREWTILFLATLTVLKDGNVGLLVH